MLLPELRLPGTEEPSQSPAMLGTLMTALFFVVRAVRQVSPEPLLLPCYSPCLGLLSVGSGRGGSSFCLPCWECPSVPPKPPWAAGLGALWGPCCPWAVAAP